MGKFILSLDEFEQFAEEVEEGSKKDMDGEDAKVFLQSMLILTAAINIIERLERLIRIIKKS